MCRQRYTFQEEKKTDVNIAVQLLADAFDNQADAICMVSGDSDVQPAIEWIARHKPELRIYLYIPSLPGDQSARRLDYLRQRVSTR
jgi:6-hydroxy-3-succinoylpyridine 3-monooxygenase